MAVACVRIHICVTQAFFASQRLFGSEDSFPLAFRGGRCGSFSLADGSLARVPPTGTFDLDQRTATLQLPTGDWVQLALSGFGSETEWKMSGRSGHTYVELKLEHRSTSTSNRALQSAPPLPPIGKSVALGLLVKSIIPRRRQTVFVWTQAIRWTTSKLYSAQFFWWNC